MRYFRGQLSQPCLHCGASYNAHGRNNGRVTCPEIDSVQRHKATLTASDTPRTAMLKAYDQVEQERAQNALAAEPDNVELQRDCSEAKRARPDRYSRAIQRSEARQGF